MVVFWNDAKYAFRQLRKSPGFTTVAVLSLALGIGVNTAVFSMINGILYKSLPVRNPHELRVINWTCHVVHDVNRMHGIEGHYALTQPGTHSRGSFPYYAYRGFAIQTEGFSDLFALSNDGYSVTINGGGISTSANARMVSGNFFQGYGAPVLIGRPITPEDDHIGAPPVTVLTYPIWQRVFGLDPHVIGRTLTVGKAGFTIIGVLPRRYVGPLDGQSRADFYVPLTAQRQLLPDKMWLERDYVWWIQMMGRLAPGADEAQIQASLEPLFSHVVNRSGAKIDRPGIVLQKGHQGILRNRRRVAEDLWPLQIVVGLVLLIACTNLAGLLLTRGAMRQHEMAVRAAMGAGRWRLVRQSLTESMILSLGGVCLGLVLSAWTRAAVSGLQIGPLSNRHFNSHIDPNVLLFALGIGLITTLLSGLFPALRASNADPLTGLKGAGSCSPPRLRLGKVLVSTQMGLSVLFVVVGGLLCRTLINLYHMDPGFDTENLLLVPIGPGESVSTLKDGRLFFDSVRQKIAAIPGVRSVALANTTLTGGYGWSPQVSIPSRPDERPRDLDLIALRVSEGYFATLGINLLDGRDFRVTDTEGSQRVVVVNEEFARLCFPDGNPLGQTIVIDDEQCIIVGLCSNHKYCGLRRSISPILYRPYSQCELSGMTCMVRSVLEPLSLVPAVRKATAEIDRNLMLEGITTQKLAIRESLRLERLMTWLIGSFALLALTLSCIGVYGLMAYNVARRTSEMGIRKALGARPWDVAWSVLRGALTLAAIGGVVGLPVALALGHLMRSLFYGIEPHDPLTVIGAVVIMLMVATLAAWIPARRAARVDPMVALRYE